LVSAIATAHIFSQSRDASATLPPSWWGTYVSKTFFILCQADCVLTVKTCGDVALFEKSIRRLHGGNTGKPQFLDQPVMVSLVITLNTPIGLRAVRGDYFNPQFGA
jgi:hypothetical protein